MPPRFLSVQRPKVKLQKSPASLGSHLVADSHQICKSLTQRQGDVEDAESPGINERKRKGPRIASVDQNIAPRQVAELHATAMHAQHEFAQLPISVRFGYAEKMALAGRVSADHVSGRVA